MIKHTTVLLKESIKNMDINPDGFYVDATLGLGGHSKEILKKLEKGKLFSFDQDKNAIDYSKNKLGNEKIFYINDNFKNLELNLKKNGINKIDGIIYDLGTSYYQLTDEERGFTYHGENVKLDMRMDQNAQKNAINILNEYSESELEKIFREYGEEKKSKILAKKIVDYRKNELIDTNSKLNKIIKEVKGYDKNKHPAKNVYQAIRIEVNNEFGVLIESLKQAINLLKVNGRIVVITFHSLEDKIVKDFFWKLKNKVKITEYENIHYFKTLKTIYPTKGEIKNNNSSRTAKVRTLVKNYE